MEFQLQTNSMVQHAICSQPQQLVVPLCFRQIQTQYKYSDISMHTHISLRHVRGVVQRYQAEVQVQEFQFCLYLTPNVYINWHTKWIRTTHPGTNLSTIYSKLVSLATCEDDIIMIAWAVI